MIDLFYNFYGLNQKLFFIINNITNLGILPYILELFSWSFFITNGVIYYFILCIYCHIKISRTQNLTDLKEKFWLYYYKLVNIGTVYAVFVFTYTALKQYIKAPRPFCSLNVHSFATIADIDSSTCFSSFPSAHTGLALLMLYFLWSYLNNFNKFIAFFVVILVAISRMTLAMHYPADVFYSFIITPATVIVGNEVNKLFSNNITKTIGGYILKWWYPQSKMV